MRIPIPIPIIPHDASPLGAPSKSLLVLRPPHAPQLHLLPRQGALIRTPLRIPLLPLARIQHLPPLGEEEIPVPALKPLAAQLAHQRRPRAREQRLRPHRRVARDIRDCCQVICRFCAIAFFAAPRRPSPQDDVLRRLGLDVGFEAWEGGGEGGGGVVVFVEGEGRERGQGLGADGDGDGEGEEGRVVEEVGEGGVELRGGWRDAAFTLASGTLFRGVELMWFFGLWNQGVSCL